MQSSDMITAYWQRFLQSTNRDMGLQYNDCFYFDCDEESANHLLQLVLEGKKRATASSLYSYKANNEPEPKAGDLCIITNWDGVPRCVIETRVITILPFGEITYDICKREGEDDTLESWQANHIHYFTQMAKEEGFTFSFDMPVVFEDFEVVY